MITKNWKLSSIFLFAFVIGLTSALSQSKSQLKQKKEKIQKELKKLNGLLVKPEQIKGNQRFNY